MVFEDVRTFLAAVDAGSIARGADALYIGQATASQRIRHLEDELGTSLLYRRAGVRKLSLTPEGKEFLGIARQWISLQRQAEEIKNLDLRQELRFVAPTMFNRYYFKDFYVNFLLKNPTVALSIKSEHATQVYRLIERQEADLGLVANQHIASGVKSRPLFKERMTIVCHADNPFTETKELRDLDASDEIRAVWSMDTELWHERHFPGNRHRVLVGDVGMIRNMMKLPGSWCLMAEALAARFTLGDEHLRYVTLPDDVMAPRIVRVVASDQEKPWLKDLIDLFLDSMWEHLANEPGITLL